MKVKTESEVAQSCPTLSDPMDCSLPGSSVHGIFQARVLEWGAIAFSIKPARILYFPTVKIYFCSFISLSISVASLLRCEPPVLRWLVPSVQDSRMSGRKAVLTFRWVSRFTLSDDGDYICQDHKTTITIKLCI